MRALLRRRLQQRAPDAVAALVGADCEAHDLRAVRAVLGRCTNDLHDADEGAVEDCAEHHTMLWIEQRRGRTPRSGGSLEIERSREPERHARGVRVEQQLCQLAGRGLDIAARELDDRDLGARRHATRRTETSQSRSAASGSRAYRATAPL